MNLLTTKEVAVALRVSTPTVRRLIREGHLEATTIGGRRRVEATSVVAFISSNSNIQTNRKEEHHAPSNN